MPTGSSIHTMVLFTSFVRKDRGVKDEKAYKIFRLVLSRERSTHFEENFGAQKQETEILKYFGFSLEYM